MKRLSLNAWTGKAAATGHPLDAVAWALGRSIESAPRLLAPVRADPADWAHPEVGWGVVLAEGAKIPPPLQRLIDQRKGPVFRCLKDPVLRHVVLRNLAAGKDIDINGAPRGTAPDALPEYLLIYGTPEAVPWSLQYVLNANRCVGRLDLAGRALDNYVNALLTGDWSGGAADARCRSNRAVVWAVNHGEGDITELMRNAIAAPVAQDLREDGQIGSGATFIDGSAAPARTADLIQALATERPALVVTTSHGMTGPLDDLGAMSRQLGLLVDAHEALLLPDELLGSWQPSGAIWYAHACCSAGSDSASSFAGLVDAGSVAGQVLAAVESLGGRTAPLPSALLGAERPLRAFIGHVEPTFDWTLKQSATGQFLTANIVEALYDRLYVSQGHREHPISLAFREWFARTNGLRAQYDRALRGFNAGEPVDELLVALQLVARDVESTVILGDPTGAMPALE